MAGALAVRTDVLIVRADRAGQCRRRPTNLTTTAVRDGDEWILNGDKWFISNAATADFIIVVAVTDPDADRHRRASQFIVPIDAPGLTVVRDIASVENPKPRPHSYGSHCEVTLRDVRLGSDAMLGGRGDGFVVAQIRLGPGRIHHCMRWIGQATRAFDMMCERATYRSAHGSLLADKQTIRNFIADSAAEIQALRLMTLHAAWRIDNEGTREARKGHRDSSSSSVPACCTR